MNSISSLVVVVVVVIVVVVVGIVVVGRIAVQGKTLYKRFKVNILYIHQWWNKHLPQYGTEVQFWGTCTLLGYFYFSATLRAYKELLYIYTYSPFNFDTLSTF